MRSTHHLLLLGLLGCGTDSASGPDKAPSDTSAAATGPDDTSCTAWMNASPHLSQATVCDTSVDRAWGQIEADGTRSVEVPSGHTALVWVPDDWSSRTHPSVLVLLHGTSGCAEGSYGDARMVFGDAHALVSLGYKSTTGDFLEADAIQRDLDAVADALSASCDTSGATWLMYGLSRGGLRAIQLGGHDRSGPRRLSGIVVDSGTAPNRQLEGPSYDGARYLFWCGENDPDPVQEGRTTCAVMSDDLAPWLERAGATVDDVVVGEDACHGALAWDCDADCSGCESRASPDNPGPHMQRIGDWLQQVSEGS